MKSGSSLLLAQAVFTTGPPPAGWKSSATWTWKRRIRSSSGARTVSDIIAVISTVPLS